LKKLSALDVQGAKFTAKGLASLPNLKQFDTLIISHCPNTTILLKALIRYQKLQKFTAFDCNLSDQDMEILSRLKTLRDLNICSSTAVTKKGLGALSKLSDLHRLMIECTSLGPECEDILPRVLKHPRDMLIVSEDRWPKRVRDSLSRKLNLRIERGNHIDVGHQTTSPVEELMWKQE